MVDVSILLAMCAVTVYGATQVIAKAAVSSLDSSTMVALNFAVSMPVYMFLAVVALFLYDGYGENLLYVLFGLIGASTARGGYYIYLEALERGPVTIVGSITAAFPAITAMLAVTVLGERLSLVNGAGVVVIIASMVGLTFSHGRNSASTTFSRSCITLSLLTLAIWGVGGIFIKLALDVLPLVAYLGLYPLILPPIAFAFLRHKKASVRIFLPKWTVPVIAAIMVAMLWQLGYFAETSAVSQGSAAIVFPLISAYPVVTIVGARVFLHERLSRTDWMFLSMVLIGMFLISVV